jgi:hypothetical protein
MYMEQSLVEILAPAYKPCRGFAEICHEMKWHPAKGHIPRGFLGATGAISDVELVLVFAEPGDPQPDEKHSAGIESALKAAGYYHTLKQDQFHKNSRYILDLCWPNLTFEKQLEKVWMTESVLCSAPVESGHVRSAVERACGERYLLRQLALFPNAVVVALGAKAQKRMRALGYDCFIAASAVAAPEGCKPHAKLSWQVIPDALAQRRRATSKPCTTADHSENTPEVAAPLDPTPKARAKPESLIGPYRVVDTSRLRANERNDPAKWSLWKLIWESSSFEELEQRAPREVLTRTNRRITWQSEARWALECGWIMKIE